MAYTPTTLNLNPGAPGSQVYFYRNSSDTMATVATAGYFTSGAGTAPTGSGPALTVGDLVYCLCSDGNFYLKASAVSATTGVATMQFAGGNLPIQTWATGTAAGDFWMKVGMYELASGVYGTGSRGVLPTPYPGAEVMVIKVDSGTIITHFDAGASGSGTAIDADNRGGTGVTYDGTARRINLVQRGDYFHVVGSSTSRWRIKALARNASDPYGGSIFFLGT